MAGCLIMQVGCTAKRADDTVTLKDTFDDNTTSALHPILTDSITDTLTWEQSEFTINNMKCFWLGKLVVLRGDTTPHPAKFDLLAADNRKVLYTKTEDADRKGFKFLRTYDGLFSDLFKDINFDGYKDILEYNKFSSGSGGSFYDVYVFDTGKKTFVLSEELSGADITVDTLQRSVTDYWKSGYGNYATNTRYYDSKGRLKYTEQINYELLPGDSGDLQRVERKRIVKGKVVKNTVDTVVFEGY